MKRIFTGILISSLVLTAVIMGSSTIMKSVDQAEHGRTLILLNKL